MEEDIQGHTEVLHQVFESEAIDDSELLLHHNNGRFPNDDNNPSCESGSQTLPKRTIRHAFNANLLNTLSKQPVHLA